MNKQTHLFLCVVVSLLSVSQTLHAQKRAKFPEMMIEPQAIKTSLDQEHELTVSGGKPPYIFKTSAGLIRYKDNTATYISPNAPGEATVTVKDANGTTKGIIIQIISDVKEPAE